MANKRKLQTCKVCQPKSQVHSGEKPAVCDKRPGHKDGHKRRGIRVRW